MTRSRARRNGLLGRREFGGRVADKPRSSENDSLGQNAMASFETFYRGLFDTFGYPLSARSAAPPCAIVAAEKRLGVRVPAALRDYYLVAGRELRFNRTQNRFLSPRDWFVDKKRVVFLEENQSVCWWGTHIGGEVVDDPPVFQGVNDDPITWRREHAKCSVFIAVMLHYHAVCDGFPSVGSATLSDDAMKALKKHWHYIGQVNKQRAYCRQNQVVFVTSFLGSEILMAGAKTKRDWEALGRDLGVTFD